MKVKPFCINIEGMSNQQVDDILNKSLAAGGNFSEGIEVRRLYKYFGLDHNLDTYFWNIAETYAEEDEDVIELRFDQLDEYLGLTKSTQKETIMTSEINDMKNTAILPEGLDEDTIQAYIKMCGDCGCDVTGFTDRDSFSEDKYLECCDIGNGLKLYGSDCLEPTTRPINIEKNTTYTVTLPERKTVTLFGTEYYEDMLAPMLSAMEDAKVPDITPSAGSGTPPIKKSL